MPKEHKHKWKIVYQDGKAVAICEQCGAKLTATDIEKLINLLERLAD